MAIHEYKFHPFEAVSKLRQSKNYESVNKYKQLMSSGKNWPTVKIISEICVCN